MSTWLNMLRRRPRFNDDGWISTLAAAAMAACGGSVVLCDCCAYRDGGEVVDVGPHILGIVKKVGNAPRGVGRCTLSLSPSESAAEDVVKHLGRSRTGEVFVGT